MFGTHVRLLCIAGLLAFTSTSQLALAESADAYDPWPGHFQ
jgi:hypothetical protein